jgi:putative ABC transport system permease protein
MSVSEFIGPTSRWLPLRFALRELRSGLNGFYVFILCIALGSMAIAGVGSVAASLTDGLAREGRVILGGDLAFTLIQRERTRVPAGTWPAFQRGHPARDGPCAKWPSHTCRDESR